MIHTGEFLVMINNEDMEQAKSKEMFDSIKVYTKDAFRIVWRNTKISNYNIHRLHIYVDFIELLGRPNIVESDIDYIIGKIRNTVDDIIGTNDFELILSRLDYRYDVKIPDKEKRKMIIRLLKKCPQKANYMKKVNKYKDNIRYFSKSRSDNVYDKEIERLAKGKKIKSYEKDILRFEAQIKNEHIKYNNRKHHVIRNFESYLTYDMYRLYMQKMIIDVVRTGDFYSLREAEKIIKKSNISEKFKSEIREFLVYTSLKRGLSKSKEKFSRYKFEKYTNYLDYLGINPITIPEKWRVKFIENPLKELINEFSESIEVESNDV